MSACHTVLDSSVNLFIARLFVLHIKFWDPSTSVGTDKGGSELVESEAKRAFCCHHRFASDLISSQKLDAWTLSPRTIWFTRLDRMLCAHFCRNHIKRIIVKLKLI